MKQIVLLLFIVFQASAMLAQSSLQKAIDAFASHASFRHASVGVTVLDVASGKMLASYDADRGLSPGSTLKVVTTATALAILRPDFQYKTQLQYDGEITAKGILNGNLYLTGQGDPTLGSDRLESTLPMPELLERLRLVVQQQGIRQIDGYLVGDDSYFGSASTNPGWQWADLGNYYAAGCWGLNIHENLYYLTFRQTRRLGDIPPIQQIDPEVPNLVFVNELKNARRGRGGNAYIYGSPYTYERYVRGTIGVGNGTITIEGSVPDPAYFAAFHFQQALQSIGISATSGIITQRVRAMRGATEKARTTLYTHSSPTLAKIVARANQKSVNLYCEALLRTLGKVQGEDDSYASSLDVLQQYWQKKGLSFDGVVLKDGSGLSTNNTVTPRFMTDLLRKTAEDETIFKAFEDSLPLAGQSGILQNKFKGSPLENNLRAKSGTLERVRSYAGYVRNRQGKLLAFCIIVNNYEGSGSAVRKRMEQLMAKLY
jgi:D-alanyl-D-alanine carboxypeptidase/D-alanyl-D-alanine-endopeptidase (penicillin-binding protein 4)